MTAFTFRLRSFGFSRRGGGGTLHRSHRAILSVLGVVFAVVLLVPQTVGAYTHTTMPAVQVQTCALTPGTPCVAIVQPSHTYTTYRSHVDTSGVCLGLPPVVGTGPDDLTFGKIAVGYRHYYDGGEGLLPCAESGDVFYRGAVRFDLSNFTNSHFIGAKLTYRVERSERHLDSGGLNLDLRGIWSASAGLDIATDPWITWIGSNHDYLNGDGSQFPVPHGQITNPTITVDVSSTVRDMLRGAAPNNGFVLYGSDEGFPRNSDTLFSIYSNFTLELTYN